MEHPERGIDLLCEQRRLEEEAMLVSLRRFNRAQRRAQNSDREADTTVGGAMVSRIVGPMVVLLSADLQSRARGRASGGGPALKALSKLDPELLCNVAARAALQRMSRPTKLVALARSIGEALEDELRWHRWESLNPAQAAAVRRRVNEASTAHHRRSALAGFARRWEKRCLEEAWSSYQLIALGTRFIDYLVRLQVFELTKIEIRKPGRKMKAAHAVQLTPQAAEWAKDMGEFLAISRPLSWPLVVPPVPWTQPFGGGFHFREGLDHPLIPRPLKPLPLVRRACKEQREMLKTADLSAVYAGLNALQGTAWRVNPRVFGVLTKLLEEGKEVPGLTALDPKAEPERLSDEEAKDPAKLRARNNEARKVKKANAQMFSKRFAQHRIYSTAKRFVTYKEIYFAYNLDFRGRVYACSDDLSPQGNDLQRGLLEFAHGDPLTDDGVDWLRVHLANCWGFDKVSFRERMAWASEHREMILRCAEDPLEHREWMQADKKSVWQFLAACFAFKDYCDHGLGVICRVPVMLDGSCSGIQHYAALLRDAEVGRAVNLVPSDKPGDLYADVAATISAATAASPAEPFALEWRSWNPCRKVVKQSVMTLPYGSTFLSNLNFVRDAARERFRLEGVPRWLNEDTEQAAFIALAQFTWNGMQESVRRPIEGMAYVKQCIRAWKAAAPARKPYWVSPCGFPVVPPHHQRSGQLQVKAAINGHEISLNYRNETTRPNWGAIETGAAPNFVHSLDASHLLLSLRRARTDGIGQLAAVHDAFGTTPTKTARFAQILREEFANLYKADPFECLRGPLRELGAKLPRPPERGTLDPNGIASATYLFS